MDQPADTGDVDDVTERAGRGRVFYEIFPGTAVSDAWLRDFDREEPPPSPKGSGELEPEPGGRR
jgi:hypothetical protein